jgi:2-methylisocitrate lyase-like PEP mutase family enzyme
MLFADGLCTREEIERFAKELRGSGAFLDANMIEGGKTPIIPAKELEQMGYSVVFWACSAVYTVTKALYDLFSGLKENGNTDVTAAGMMEFGKFNQFIGLDHYKELERKYKVDRDD